MRPDHVPAKLGSAAGRQPRLDAHCEGPFLLARIRDQVFPLPRREPGPFLESKPAPGSRCPAHGDQGCLDGDGSGTAEWIAAGLVAAKACRQDHRSDNPASVTLGVASRPGLAGTNPVRGVRNRAGEPTAAAKHARGRGPPGPHAQTGVRKRNRTPSDCAPSRWAGRSWAGRGARGPS